MRKDLWTRNELIVALNLYLKLPFGKLHSRTPEIIELAGLINRSANAVAMRLNNFASVDPYHQKRGIKGLVGGIKQVQPIWDEFANNKEGLIYESEKYLASTEKTTLEKKYDYLLKGLQEIKGETKERIVKTRINQNVFRQIVLSNYSYRCAVTGIVEERLLIASHIIPWAENKEERLNPQNGICLNSLHDRAFDAGLITITPDYKIKISSKINNHSNSQILQDSFYNYEGKTIILPSKILPNSEFLKYHNDVKFIS